MADADSVGWSARRPDAGAAMVAHAELRAKPKISIKLLDLDINEKYDVSREMSAFAANPAATRKPGGVVTHFIRVIETADPAGPAAFEVRSDEHLLRGMERLGRRGIPVGCRGGGCGVCKVQVLTGDYRTLKMSRDCVSSAEQAQGYALACRLYAESDLDIRVVGKMVRAFNRTETGTAAGRDSVTVGKPPAFDMSWRK